MSRTRMIFDVPREVQMAIRLRAVKAGMTTGDVVAAAIAQAFPDEVREAKETVSHKSFVEYDITVERDVAASSEIPNPASLVEREAALREELPQLVQNIRRQQALTKEILESITSAEGTP